MKVIFHLDIIGSVGTGTIITNATKVDFCRMAHTIPILAGFDWRNVAGHGRVICVEKEGTLRIEAEIRDEYGKETIEASELSFGCTVLKSHHSEGKTYLDEIEITHFALVAKR